MFGVLLGDVSFGCRELYGAFGMGLLSSDRNFVRFG